MHFVVKSHPQMLEYSQPPSVVFTEWAYEGARPAIGDDVVWFTDETSNGHGLYGLGMALLNAESAGSNNKGNRLIRFRAGFRLFAPSLTLCNTDFAELERIGTGTPIQELNRRLYMNSHVKIAEIDDETFEYLSQRFQ